MPAQDFLTVLTAATHNGAVLGVVVDYSVLGTFDKVFARDQGAMRASAIGITGRSVVSQVTWMAEPGQGPVEEGTNGALAFISNKTKAGAGTIGAAKQTAFDFTISHSDRTFALITQTFIEEDPDDASVVSIS